MSNLISRYGPTILTLLAVIGISIFIAYFVVAFADGGGREYEYSSPLAPMWTGIGTLWFSIAFTSWWTCSQNLTTRKTDTKDGLWTLYLWVLYSLLFAMEGFVALIGWAHVQNEEATSGLSTLWVVTGGVAASMVIGLVRAKRNPSTPNNSQKKETAPDVEVGTDDFHDDTNKDNGDVQEEEEVQTKKGRCSWCICCCTKRFWLDLFFLVATTFLLVFSTGFMMQATASANDANNLTPPGQIYTFPVTMSDGSSMDVQMHLYCLGEKQNATTNTVILEHGGGANSITMLALAQELQATFGTRACVYDRLGYGYSPSYFTSTPTKSLPNTGAILSNLLQAAGEEGPYVCAGHSAGSEACLWFAHSQQELMTTPSNAVTGVAMLDGYPDIIRAGSFRPGVKPDQGDGPLASTQAFAVLTGGTGLTRGLVGDQGENFVPSNQRDTVKSLYGQARFWFVQYWDVRSDMESDDSTLLYQQLNGSVNGDTGVVTYGGTLSGTKVLVLPAEKTVADLDCEGKDSGDYCCGNAKDSTQCQNYALDRSIYRAQNDLYASTLSNDTAGLVIQGPAGSEHGFVNHKDYYQWIATQIGEQLLM